MNRPKTFFATAVLFLAVAVSACTYAITPSAVLPAVPATVDAITPEELRMHLQFLASPELGGRYTLAPNFTIVARYLAAHLEAYGFHGAAGDHNDFLQTFQVVSAKADMAKSSLALTAQGKESAYHFGDFYMNGLTANGEAQGQIVFVGYGVSAASQQHDDYAGIDVKGKIVMIVLGAPAGVDTSRLGENEQGQGAARAHGAVGILIVPSQRMLDIMKGKGFQERAAARESVRLARETDGLLPMLTLGPALAEELIGNTGLDVKEFYETVSRKQNFKARKLDVTAKMAAFMQLSRTTTQNVTGILEGTDPALRNEYVVFSAHYDHLKAGPSGEIYPGADDDGSGTTAVLNIAHAMSLNRPKRSVLVIFHAGEELGLLGSAYNTDFAPVVPLDKLVVDLNIDMIGRSKPAGDKELEDEHLTDANSVYLVGSNRISRELHEISEETNSEFQKMKLDYHYNDPNNPERIYYRSDHWNYAKHGVPIIFYFDGTHVDYHRPTDTVDKIDFGKLTRITRLVFETGWRLANLDHRLAKTPQ